MFDVKNLEAFDKLDSSLIPEGLISEIRSLAKKEQGLTLQVIELIAQIDQKKLFYRLGFPSLYDFVTQDLGYEAASAMRRIQAARLLQDLPDMKEKIESKKLSLSVVSQAQSYFRKKDLPAEQKREILKTLENKSSRQAELELVKLDPLVQIPAKGKQRAISSEFTEHKFVLDAQTQRKLEELKLWMSHQNSELSTAKLIQILIDQEHKRNLKQKEPKQNKPPAKEPPFESKFPTSDAEVGKQSRFISVQIKRTVWDRDQGCCQYRNPINQQKCGSRYQVQFDHNVRFRDGGLSNEENLRLLCAQHNRLRN